MHFFVVVEVLKTQNETISKVLLHIAANCLFFWFPRLFCPFPWLHLDIAFWLWDPDRHHCKNAAKQPLKRLPNTLSRIVSISTINVSKFSFSRCISSICYVLAIRSAIKVLVKAFIRSRYQSNIHTGEIQVH